MKKKYKDNKGAIRSRISKDRNTMAKRQKDKQRSTEHYTEQATRTPLKTGVNSCPPEG